MSTSTLDNATETVRRPEVMKPTDDILANVPAALKELPCWVTWKYVERDGKPTKCPVDAKTGAPADSTDPATWTTFDVALAAYQADSLAGVGFVFAPDGGLCGVDLDDSIDPATGQLKAWARAIVERLNSYTEISPSGHGVKIFLRAKKPGSRCRKGYEDGEVEMYDSGRFFTVTGRRLPEVSANVEEREDALAAIYKAVFGVNGEATPAPGAAPQPQASASQSPPALVDAPARLTDEAIIKKACSSRKNGAKFSALWDGQWNNYFNSASEADSSVILTLAFYTKDAAQIDRLFRRSRLYRPKWDERHGEKTYGEITIAKALEMVTGQYQPRGRRKKGAAPRPQPPPSAPGDPALPVIVVGDIQLRDLTAQGMAAIQRANSPPVVFVRSDNLGRVVRNKDGIPVVETIDKIRLRSRLTEVAAFYAVNKEGAYVGTNPPLYLAENILAQGTWDFPPLVGIARAPILRHDGTVCTTPGYDPGSRLFYMPDAGLAVPDIPEHPTVDQVRAAVDLLIDLIAEFPFADAASHANALAVLLTLLMRPVISGHVPLAIADAPIQGTGKTLLLTVLGRVAVGQVSGESIPSRQNEDEWRKKITSVLLDAPPFVLLDNIPDNTTVDSACLAAMLTTYVWSDRLLGKNEHVHLPSRSVWVASGNNLRVTGDMPRRCYTVRMDANVEKPWTRTGFRHADLEEYARSQRGNLLAAAFTVIRSWYAAGKPKASMPAFGSFQEWTDTIGSVLAHAGVEGFLGNLDQIRAVQDDDTQQWRAFFTAWWEAFGEAAVTADDLCHRILAHNTIPDESLPDTVVVNRDKGEGSLKRSLGRNLARLTGRIFDARKLCASGLSGKKHVRIWTLTPAVTSPLGHNLAVTSPVTSPTNPCNENDLDEKARLARLFPQYPRTYAGACAHARAQDVSGSGQNNLANLADDSNCRPPQALRGEVTGEVTLPTENHNLANLADDEEEI